MDIGGGSLNFLNSPGALVVPSRPLRFLGLFLGLVVVSTRAQELGMGQN